MLVDWGDGSLAVELPTLPPGPGRAGQLNWACRGCRDGRRGSTASHESRPTSAARAWGKLARDPRRGQRRPGESWNDEARREQRLGKAEAALKSQLDRLDTALAHGPDPEA